MSKEEGREGEGNGKRERRSRPSKEDKFTKLRCLTSVKRSGSLGLATRVEQLPLKGISPRRSLGRRVVEKLFQSKILYVDASRVRTGILRFAYAKS